MLYMLEVLEVMRCVLFCMLEVVEGDRCVPELLEMVHFVLEIMLCVISTGDCARVLGAVESVPYVLEVLEDMCYALLDLYAGGRGGDPLCAGAAEGCARSTQSAGAWKGARVLLCMLEAVESVRYLVKVPEVIRYAIDRRARMLCAGVAEEHAMCAVGAGGCVLSASGAGVWRRGAVCSSACCKRLRIALYAGGRGSYALSIW